MFYEMPAHSALRKEAFLRIRTRTPLETLVYKIKIFKL